METVMKIVFLHGGNDLYGASRCLLRLAAALCRDGHQAEAWIPGDGPIRPALEAAGVPCITVPELSPVSRGKYAHFVRRTRFGLNIIPSAASLARRIRSVQPDIVHTNTAVLPAAGLAARLAGKPHLWHVREWFGEFPNAWALYQWYLALSADRVICVSQAIADQYYPAPRKRARVVYDGFPDSDFQSVGPERAQAFRRACGLEGFLAVGVVGRIKWKRKGQEVFLRAAARLRESHPDVRFLCIGSPFPGNEGHLQALQDLAAELHMGPEWKITGDVTDNLGAIAALDVLVHPPGQPEPFAGVVIEAMGLGKPVVGTTPGGTSEQVEDGVTGFLVPPDNPPALAAALQKLLDDGSLRRGMGTRGRKRFLDRFSWPPFYRSILNAYSVAAGDPLQ
jgi:glycosyltransferase involved in cell wall biosynthesis